MRECSKLSHTNGILMMKWSLQNKRDIRLIGLKLSYISNFVYTYNLDQKYRPTHIFKGNKEINCFTLDSGENYLFAGTNDYVSVQSVLNAHEID